MPPFEKKSGVKQGHGGTKKKIRKGGERVRFQQKKDNDSEICGVCNVGYVACDELPCLCADQRPSCETPIPLALL